MEFPDTKATRLTEKIMRKVQENTDKHAHTRLDSTTYNRVYEAVYDTLDKELEMNPPNDNGGGAA